MELFKEYVESGSHMVFGWDITKTVKKKNFATSKDKKDWLVFTKQMGSITPKDSDFLKKEEVKKVKKLDLHGFSLIEANKIVSDAKESIENQKMAALIEVKNHVAQLSLEIAEKVIKQKLEKADSQEKFIGELLEEIK